MYKVIWLREYEKRANEPKDCEKRANEPKDCEKWLNGLEKEGWKLVGITNHNYYGYWVFHKE